MSSTISKTIEIDDIYYEAALIEINYDQINKGLWGKAIVSSDGDDQKLKSHYVAYSAQNLSSKIKPESMKKMVSFVSHIENIADNYLQKNIQLRSCCDINTLTTHLFGIKDYISQHDVLKVLSIVKQLVDYLTTEHTQLDYATTFLTVLSNIHLYEEHRTHDDFCKESGMRKANVSVINEDIKLKKTEVEHCKSDYDSKYKESTQLDYEYNQKKVKIILLGLLITSSTYFIILFLGYDIAAIVMSFVVLFITYNQVLNSRDALGFAESAKQLSLFNYNEKKELTESLKRRLKSEGLLLSKINEHLEQNRYLEAVLLDTVLVGNNDYVNRLPW
jgi:hypothetical protein